MKFKNLILAFLTFVGILQATPLPFFDTFSVSDPIAHDSTCFASRPNGDENANGCGPWKDIGAMVNPPWSPTIYRPSKNALECVYTKDEDKCQARLYFAETDSLWVQQDMKFASNFDFGSGMKIFRLVAYPDTFWNDHILYTTTGNPFSSQSDMDRLCAEPNGGTGQYGCVSISFTRGVYHRIKVHMKMNHPNQFDGWCDVWVDGVLVISNHALGNFLRTPVRHGFTQINLGGWWSSFMPDGSPGKIPPAQPDSIWYQNVYVGLVDPGTWPGAITLPPVVGPVVDTAFVVYRDTTHFQVVKRTTVRFITIPAIVNVDTTAIIRDTTQVP